MEDNVSLVQNDDIDEEGFSKTIDSFMEVVENMTDEEFKKFVDELCETTKE